MVWNSWPWCQNEDQNRSYRLSFEKANDALDDLRTAGFKAPL
jgi:hypothetical protein